METKYFLTDDGINIKRSHKVVIKEKIFEEELFDYKIVHREELIDDLIRWISEASKDKDLMKEDLKMLMTESDDDYIFSSIKTNDYIHSLSDNFNETCEALLELNEEANYTIGKSYKYSEIPMESSEHLEVNTYGDELLGKHAIHLRYLNQEIDIWFTMDGFSSEAIFKCVYKS